MFKQQLIFGLTFALVALPGLAQVRQSDIDLPQLGNPADLSLSPAEEDKLGAEVVAEMYAYDYIVDDPEITEYLSAVGWKLAASDPSTPNPPKFNFYLIADDRINAFALPGGYIGFNAGTVIAAQNESELAGVLGHEESHVTQRHIARQAGDTKVADIATWIGVLAAILAGSGNPNVILGALGVGQGINYQRQVSYTRGNELEADRFGIRKMAAAGYDPMGMATFFGRLEQETRLYGSHLPEILLTHPVNTTRIAEATERAAQFGPRMVKDSADFTLMKVRTRVLAFDSPNDAQGYFYGEIKAGHDTPENHYGYAMSLGQLGQNTEALAALKPALDFYPKQVNVLLLEGSLLVGAGKTKEAMDLFSRTLNSYPRYPPAILEYAEALINTGSPDQARQILLSHDQALGTRVETFRLLATAARASGNIAEAQYQQAEFLARRGDLPGAIEQLNVALRVASVTGDDRARLLARRQELLNSIPRSELQKLQGQG